MDLGNPAAVATRRHPLRTFAAMILGAVFLCAVTAVNGYPFFFNDSADYVLVGRDIVETLAQRFGDAAPAATATATATTTAPSAAAAAAPAARSDPMVLTYIASRSAYFSLLTGGLMAIAGVWGPVLMQALASAWIVWLLVRAHAPARPLTTYLVTVAVLSLASSLPFFVGFVMPDVYAGWDRCALAACAVLGSSRLV